MEDRYWFSINWRCTILHNCKNTFGGPNLSYGPDSLGLPSASWTNLKTELTWCTCSSTEHASVWPDGNLLATLPFPATSPFLIFSLKYTLEWLEHTYLWCWDLTWSGVSCSILHNESKLHWKNWRQEHMWSEFERRNTNFEYNKDDFRTFGKHPTLSWSSLPLHKPIQHTTLALFLDTRHYRFSIIFTWWIKSMYI